MPRRKKLRGQFQNSMDTEKLISLAYKSKEEAQKYRSQLCLFLKENTKKHAELTLALKRLKAIPGSEKAVEDVNKQLHSLDEEIQDCYNAVNIINSWEY